MISYNNYVKALDTIERNICTINAPGLLMTYSNLMRATTDIMFSKHSNGITQEQLNESTAYFKMSENIILKILPQCQSSLDAINSFVFDC